MDEYEWECKEMKSLKTRMSDRDIAWAVQMLDQMERQVKEANRERQLFRDRLNELADMVQAEDWEK